MKWNEIIIILFCAVNMRQPSLQYRISPVLAVTRGTQWRTTKQLVIKRSCVVGNSFLWRICMQGDTKRNAELDFGYFVEKLQLNPITAPDDPNGVRRIKSWSTPMRRTCRGNQPTRETHLGRYLSTSQQRMQLRPCCSHPSHIITTVSRKSTAPQSLLMP